MKCKKKFFASIVEVFTRNLFFLTNAMIFSEFGNVIYSTALSFWILDITHSTLLMGWISFISVIPQLMLSPMIGVFVDRHNTKKIMLSMDVIRGISMCLFGLITLFGINDVTLILVNSIVLAISNCFYQTSVNASLIYIFKKDKFVESNSIANSIINLAEITAASMAGFLISILSAPILFIINGVTFFISAFSSLFLKMPLKNEKTIKKNLKAELRESIILCKNNRYLMNFVSMRCILGILLQINTILIIPLFKVKYDEILYGISNSFQIAGTLIGGIILVYLKKYLSESKILMFSLTVLILSVLAVVNIPIIYVIPVLMFLVGFSTNIYNILTESNIVLLVPTEHRAKALAIIFQVIFFFTSIGSLLGGVIGNYINIPFILTVNSILILIFSIFFYRYRINKFESENDLYEK